MVNLKRIQLQGFRSLRDVTLDLTSRVTVLIGPNGAGKSNLLQGLRMLSSISTDSLGLFVGESGGANSLLRDGPKVTPEMSCRLEFDVRDEVGSEQVLYSATLRYAAGDRLMFREEHASLGDSPVWSWSSSGGNFETALPDLVGLRTGRKWEFKYLLGRMGWFHFHDTSYRSAIRATSREADKLYLRPDGSNLAAYLLRMKRSGDQAPWKRIMRLVRLVAPFVKDLVPDPGAGAEHVRLDWVDTRDAIFGPHQLSDGTLRAIALFTALARNKDHMPAFLTIDEPELGLHPAAISLLCDVVRLASEHSQIMLATQSPAILNHFSPDEVVVVEWNDGESTLRRLNSEELHVWLEDYTLAELYDKNLLGGRP